MRYGISNSPTKITFTVEAKWNWWSFLGAPLAVAAYWQFMATHGDPGDPPVKLLILTAVVMAAQALWTLGGRQTLSFSEDELIAQSRVLFFARSRRFPAREISEPFFVPAERGGGEDGETPSGLGFDWQGAYYRFLDHIEEADFAQILLTVRGSLPELARLWNDPKPAFARDGITTLGLSSPE
jgi:hypothetical protein